MSINRKYAVWSAVLVLALALGVFVYTDKASAPTQSATQTATHMVRVSLTVDGLYTAKQIEVEQGKSVLDTLQMLNIADPQLQLVIKEYAGMGTLVVGMHGVTNGAGKKYWQYKVNGVMPQVGADQLKLKDGDSVDWFFGESQQ